MMEKLLHPATVLPPYTQSHLSTHHISTFLSTIYSSPSFTILFRVLTLLLPIVAGYCLYKDYNAFLSLGPGGTPATPLGYAKIKFLSIISLRNPYRALPVPPHFRPQKGYLASLPKREGKRPCVAGIAPQRQQTAKSSPEVYAKLVERLKQLSKNPANHLLERTSCFEKHSSGLFASTPITRTCGGEICHAHPSDGSLHMVLHPADAKLVLENGWGERHPLAKGGWFRRFVPREFVLIYAPRNEAEVGIVMGIVEAGIWWVSGIDVHGTGSEDAVGQTEGVGRRDSAKGGMEEELKQAQRDNECWACQVHGCGTKEHLVGEA